MGPFEQKLTRPTSIPNCQADTHLFIELRRAQVAQSLLWLEAGFPSMLGRSERGYLRGVNGPR